MESMNEWEIVKPGRAKTSKFIPSIYISKNGSIIFSKASLEGLQKNTPNEDIYSYKKAEIYFSKKTNEYAFKFGDEGQLTLLKEETKTDKNRRKICKTELAKMLGFGTIEIKRFEENMIIFEKKEEG